ncbi:MAG: glycosyltransferase [Puniceicoccaceae bacterium]
MNGNDHDFLSKEPFLIHAIGPTKSSWAYSNRLIPWLTKNVTEYDTVVQHGLWQYLGYALSDVISKRKKEGLTTPTWYIYPHGMLDPWFQKAESRKLKAIRNWFYWKLIENRVVAAADSLLFTCEEEMRLAEGTFRPYKPKSVHNVGYGIPEPPDNGDRQIAAFHSVLPHLKDKPFLLFLSRIHPKKGVELLLKAYADLKSQGIQDLPYLVIAGPCANESHWNELQSLAVSLNLQQAKVPYNCSQFIQITTTPPSDVFWTGMLSGDLKWGALRAADAFILPSHQENFGIAVVEALACGTPVLISNKVNIWREIKAANAGLVSEDTESGTQELISNWLELSPLQKNEIISSTIKCFTNDFGVDNAANRLTKLLNGEPL